MAFIPSAVVCTFLQVTMLVSATSLTKPEGKLGDVGCDSERDCAPNAYCIDNRYCMCMNDFVQDSITQTCLPIPKHMNETCKIDLQCRAQFGNHAVCYKPMEAGTLGQCKCGPNSHFQDGICYSSVPLGGRCKVSNDCVSTSDAPTYCSLSTCVCTVNFHPSANKLDCIPDVVIGKACRKDEECVSEHAYCDRICSCQMGFIRSSDNTTCLKVAKSLREGCEEDSQCQKYLQNTFCDVQEKICKCVPLSHEVDKICWMSSRLGEQCSHPDQCIIPSHNRSAVTCSKGVCTCAFGHKQESFDCVHLKSAQGVTADSTSLGQCVLLVVAIVFLNFLYR